MIAVLSIVALVVGVGGALSRPFRLPAWALPVAAAAVVMAGGAISTSGARRALAQLGEPLAFLLGAVPLAVLLDRLGFFAAAAARLTRRSPSVGGLWVLAALVTTVLNLDAAVVLLTPLYVSIARRRGVDPLLLAAQPVLLACLASSALPVSNLTNLIAASATGAGVGAFLSHLALPSVVASSVGWWRYRALLRRFPPGAGGAGERVGVGEPGARRALVLGGAVVAVVLVGFSAGDRVGIAPWEVVLAADVVLVGIEVRARVVGTAPGNVAAGRAVPWRAVPVGTALLAGSLAVLAAAAVVHLPVHQLIGGTGVAALARSAGVAALGANLVDNLPALLVALPAAGPGVTPSLWAVLLGVNMGPVLVATGSLASLLWLDALRRLGVPARARDFSRLGVQVGLPGALAGVGTALALAAAGIVS